MYFVRFDEILLSLTLSSCAFYLPQKNNNVCHDMIKLEAFNQLFVLFIKLNIKRYNTQSIVVLIYEEKGNERTDKLPKNL